jgi:hypothetical protein
MYDEQLAQPANPKRKRIGLKVALIGAGIAAGAIGATAIGASAQSSGTTSTSSTAPAAPTASNSNRGPGGPGDHDGHDGHGRGPGGAAPVRDDEKAVTGSTLATLKAAALKAVPGGTVIRVETDAGDGVYEAHMTKADGTPVTVKFDKNLAVIKVEAGMGSGDPAPTDNDDH